MTSYKSRITPRRRKFVRLIGDIQEELQRVLMDEHEATGITQADIARALDKHPSVVSRALSGRSNLTLETIAELAWALNREILFRMLRSEEILGYQPNDVGEEAVGRFALPADDSNAATTRPGPEKRWAERA